MAVAVVVWPAHFGAFLNRLLLGSAHYPSRTALERIIDFLESAPSATMSSLEIGNAAIGAPTPLFAWIDPFAAAELTTRYKTRFDALWERVLAADGSAAPEVQERAPDRRFSAKEWREQPYFMWLKNAYLLYAEYLHELAALAQADPHTKKRLTFLAQQYAEALAPSNFLPTNPEALKLALDTGGKSVAQGLSNLVADCQRGRIAMTDEAADRFWFPAHLDR